MADWVDFAAIKQSIGLAPVLQRYQVRLRRSGLDQYRGRCPIHHGASREAFHANLARNIFHCFSCGAGGTVLDFVAAMESCTLREAALQLQHDGAMLGPWLLPAGLPPQRVTKRISSPMLLGLALRGVDSTHPYLAARGIESRTAHAFGVGFYSGPGLLHHRIVIPIHNERGERIAYAGRTLDGTEPRYRFPAGFPKSEILFNLHRALAAAEPAVVVVEGFFDCLKVHQAGICCVVALMGSVLYPAQQRALERFPRVLVMLDGDGAGQRGSTTAAARLRPRCRVELIHLPAAVQPDQLSAAAIRNILEVHSCRSVARGSQMP